MTGGFHPAQGFDDIRAEAINIGDGRVLTDPDAVINAAAKVFGEVTVDVGVDRGDRISRVECDLGGCHHRISFVIGLGFDVIKLSDASDAPYSLMQLTYLLVLVSPTLASPLQRSLRHPYTNSTSPFAVPPAHLVGRPGGRYPSHAGSGRRICIRPGRIPLLRLRQG